MAELLIQVRFRLLKTQDLNRIKPNFTNTHQNSETQIHVVHCVYEFIRFLFDLLFCTSIHYDNLL